MKSKSQSTISLLVPVYNEEQSIDVFLDVTLEILKKTKMGFEIIFIDDGSTDETLSVLLKKKEQHKEIKVISLTRNFGKEAALTAGLDHADGDAVIPIDVDLQDPPEAIFLFLEKWREGFDVVYGIRRDRQSDTWLKRKTALAFYRLFNRMSNVKIPYNSGDFRLMDRRVVEEIKKLKERNRFMKGLMCWPGFRSTSITFDRQKRAEGNTSWNYLKLINFGVDGLISFSTIPLRIWIYIGASVSVFAFLYASFIILRVLFTGVDIPGYASLIVVTMFFAGVQLITLGVLGEYIGRIYEEVKGRPVYIVDRIWQKNLKDVDASIYKVKPV